MMDVPKFLQDDPPSPPQEELKFEETDFAEDNPTTRLAVCLCLDTSGSMESCMDELNAGVRSFYEEVRKDPNSKYSLEIAIVTFGPDVKQVRDFQPLDKQTQPPVLSAGGRTPMGEAVTLALELLERRKGLYKERGIDYYQPWLVLMTDGLPTDPAHVVEDAARRAAEITSNKKLTVFPIAIGAEAGLAELQRFSPANPPKRLTGYKFRELFGWFSENAINKSKSIPGDDVALTPTISWSQN
jgi:uncharacterized protein YegL